MYASDCIALILSAYLLGSIPFGLVLSHAFGLPDPRTLGSGNIGATNMLRTGRKDVAALTLLLDGLKGAAAVWLGHLAFESTPAMSAVAAMMAAAGHIYSPWLKFKGGKGVATTIGAALAFSPILGGMEILIWLLVFVITGISSLSAILALVLLPILSWWVFEPRVVLILAATSALVLYKHKANISRLLRGEEPRFFTRKGKGTQ